MNSGTDWTGLLLSIPIGIVTGLITPPIQRWLQARGKDKALKDLARAREELAEVTYYVENPHIFTQYLVQVAIRTTFIGAVLGILGGVAFMFGSTPLSLSFTWGVDLQLVFIAAGQAATTMGSVMIVGICRPALRLWTRVRNYDEYANEFKRKYVYTEVVTPD